MSQFPTYAHFPDRAAAPPGATCGDCAHRRTYQSTVKDGKGGLVPMGLPVHWCQLCADFIGATPGRAAGGKPKGIGRLSLHDIPCKYFTRSP